jgi:ribosomal protein S3AE
MAIAKRKKRFFDVDMPIINKQTQLQAYEIKDLEGKFIKYDLTRLLRGQSMLIKLKVKVEGDKITSIPKEIKLMPYFLRRMVRKGTNYVEDSFSVKCKDAQVRIKPFLITRKKVSRAVRKALREKAREELIKYVKDKKSNDLFDEILKNKIQKPLSLKLKKIYPLSLCEIRVFKVEKELETKEENKPKEDSKETINLLN